MPQSFLAWQFLYFCYLAFKKKMSLGEHFLKSTKKILSTVWPHLTLRLVVLASDSSSPAGQGFWETDFVLVWGSKLCFSFVSTILSFVQKYFVNQSTLQREKFQIFFFPNDFSGPRISFRQFFPLYSEKTKN